MKRYTIILLLLPVLIFITSCNNDRLYLEDTTITLSAGLDHDENNNLVVYQVSPVFSKDAKDKQKVLSTDNILSIRNSRNALNASSKGSVVSGKVQVLMLGKQLLGNVNPIDYLDVFYRDPKTAINVVMIAVDGPVSDIINFTYEGDALLSVYLKDLIETAYRNKITVKTELDDFYTQLLNKGITPYITEIRRGEKEVVVMGTALLKNDGTYATSLNKEETSLLLLLQGDTGNPANFTFKLSKDEQQKHTIGIVVQNSNRSITTNYINDRFYFDIQMDIDVVFIERTYPANAEGDIVMLENIFQKKLQQGLNEVIATIQDHAIDPIGLGNYARAYQYQEWKKVQDHWGEALANAEITVSPRVKLKSFGAIK